MPKLITPYARMKGTRYNPYPTMSTFPGARRRLFSSAAPSTVATSPGYRRYVNKKKKGTSTLQKIIKKEISKTQDKKQASYLIGFTTDPTNSLGRINAKCIGTADFPINRGTAVKNRVGDQIQITGLTVEASIQDLRNSAGAFESAKPRHHMFYLVKSLEGVNPETNFFRIRGNAGTSAWGTEANARPNTLTTCPKNSRSLQFLASKQFTTYGDDTNTSVARSYINEKFFIPMDQTVRFLINSDQPLSIELLPQLWIVHYSWDPTKVIGAQTVLSDMYVAYQCTLHYRG